MIPPQIQNRTLFTSDTPQLRCAMCNRTKGTDTMPDLSARLAASAVSRISFSPHF